MEQKDVRNNVTTDFHSDKKGGSRKRRENCRKTRRQEDKEEKTAPNQSLLKPPGNNYSFITSTDTTRLNSLTMQSITTVVAGGMCSVCLLSFLI